MITPANAPDPITQNIESIAAFFQREDQNVSWSQRVVEAISNVVGRPIFLGCIVLFVTLWILANVVAGHVGMAVFDAPPFSGSKGSSVYGHC